MVMVFNKNDHNLTDFFQYRDNIWNRSYMRFYYINRAFFTSIYCNVRFRRAWCRDTIEGSSIPCHFLRRGGVYSTLLPQDCINNSNGQLSHTNSLLPKPLLVNQVVVAAIMISGYICRDRTMYLHMNYVKFVLAAPGAKTLAGVLLLCGGATILWQFADTFGATSTR